MFFFIYKNNYFAANKEKSNVPHVNIHLYQPHFNMTTVFNYLNCLLLLILFIGNANAQSPGGVSTDLGLWLKADGLAAATPLPTTGTYIGTSNWPDASGHPNNNDAIFHPSIAGTSVYAIFDEINFNSSIRINNEWFDSPVDINQPNVNVFMVYKLKDNSTNRPLWGNGDSFAGKQAFVQKVSDGTGYTSYGPAKTQNKTYLNHINTVDGGASNNSSIYINGNTGTFYTNGTTVDNNVHAGILIGKEEVSRIPGANINTLSLAECVVYTGGITAGERERINSYLAIKYGITLGHDYTINSGGTTVWDLSVNGNNYNSNIIGLARDNTSGLNTTKSKSEDSDAWVKISTTGTIPNNEAFLIGRNSSVTTNSSAFSTDNFFVKGRRMNRVWKCQKTANFTIPVDIGIDRTIALPTSGGFESGNLVLLVSNQANMNNNNVKAYPLIDNPTSGNYEATGVDINDGQFFTIGYLDVALWIKADASQNVTTLVSPHVYHDNVLGINSMYSTATSTNPTHVAGTDPSSINFNPYIKFNDNVNLDQYIEKADLTAFGNAGVSTFLVLRRDDIGVTLHESMLSYATSSQSNQIVITNPSNLTVSIDRNNLNDGHNSSKDITNSIPHVFTNITGEAINDDNEIRLDGDGTTALERNGVVIPSKGTLVFGQEQDNPGGGFVPNQAYEGDIAEAIIFNKVVTDNHRDGIETYLAIKYGVTLTGNYKKTNASVLWNSTTNSIYHNNIAGIGREDALNFSQQASTSQNGATVDVLISNIGSFSINTSYLIWGCNSGIYDNLSPANAPAGYQTSDKIWKVKNLNNRVGTVDVTLKIPTSLLSIGTNKLKLIVENNSGVFSTTANLYPSISNNNGSITFTGVTLGDDDYFTLALEDSPTDVTYNNAGNTIAPTSFEACIGDVITITYNNLTSHPNELQLMDDQGAAFSILLVSGANINYNQGLGSSGVITVTIPSNIATGNVKLIDTNASGTGVVHSFNNNLIIHKPVVDFYLPQAPFCATDTVPLIGVPTGGTFSSTLSNLILNNNT